MLFCTKLFKPCTHPRLRMSSGSDRLVKTYYQLKNAFILQNLILSSHIIPIFVIHKSQNGDFYNGTYHQLLPHSKYKDTFHVVKKRISYLIYVIFSCLWMTTRPYARCSERLKNLSLRFALALYAVNDLMNTTVTHKRHTMAARAHLDYMSSLSERWTGGQWLRGLINGRQVIASKGVTKHCMEHIMHIVM